LETDNIKPIHTMKLIREGEDVSMKCYITSNAEWYFKEDKLPENTRIFNDNTLVIYNVNIFNTGYYDCVGTNEYLKYSFVEIYLQVYGKFSILLHVQKFNISFDKYVSTYLKGR